MYVCWDTWYRTSIYLYITKCRKCMQFCLRVSNFVPFKMECSEIIFLEKCFCFFLKIWILTSNGKKVFMHIFKYFLRSGKNVRHAFLQTSPQSLVLSTRTPHSTIFSTICCLKHKKKRQLFLCF
jgi:hypothetical protein